LCHRRKLRPSPDRHAETLRQARPKENAEIIPFSYPDAYCLRRWEVVMDRLNAFWIAVAAWVGMVIPAGAEQQAVPPPPILVTAPVVTTNNSPGDQTDPHVRNDLVSYTDIPAGSIRYNRFSTGANTVVPALSAAFNVLSDVNGDRIVLTSIQADRNA